MNKWVQKSIKLANAQGYLDKLFEVYPIETGPTRTIGRDVQEKMKAIFDSRNKIHLVRGLLSLPRFPIDDPYLASLRRHDSLLEKNPGTVKRISQKLFALGFDKILELINKPKSASRQFGSTFQKWLHSKDYKFLEWNDFKDFKGVAFLEGSDNVLQRFVQKEVGIKNLKRKPDFLLKTRDKFVIGEAKFLTDYGGTQNNQFDSALRISELKNKNAIGVAVLDGIVWFNSNSYMHRKVKNAKGVVFSALLFDEFIKKR
ncbi:MAG: hypothetical protein PHE77_00350 [Candidatus Pacebacteria bacterium]|nr:hypothetical protein [Candidatus Paceibacterota bacterium]